MKRKKHSGAALMLALWALFLLSAMVIAWAVEIDSRIKLSGRASRALEAEAMACSGAEVALNPQVKPGSSLLRRDFDHGQNYEAKIVGEGGRLNLNWIIAGENPARIEILRKYLELKKIDLNDRDHMIDCLLDYVDPDDLARLNGAEAEPGYQPKNAPFARIEEVKKVRGWEKFTSDPDWDSDFTLKSTGPIDLVWASRDVLLSLPGMTDGIVDRFIQQRRGPDGQDGTEDDAEFKNQEEVRLALGFSPDQFKQLAGLVSFRDQVLRVVSVGRSGDVKRTVQMVIRKSGPIPQLITWKEQ